MYSCVTTILRLSLSVAAPALRTPLSIAGSYPTPFAMMGHDMNGGLTSPGVYAGLHISPQMSAAAAAAYGRSPMVTRFSFVIYAVWDNLQALHMFKILAQSWIQISKPFCIRL